MNKRYYYLDESPIYPNKYVLRMEHDNFLFPNGTKGSYNLFAARLLNLNYVDYLRYCRDRLGAELVGKGKRYVTVLFDMTKESQMLVKLLNSRMELIMNEHHYPYEYKEGRDGSIERTDL